MELEKEQALVLEEALDQVSVLGWVSKEAWSSIPEEKQLTQLFSTQNNLSIHSLLRGPSNLLLAYSRSSFYSHHKKLKIISTLKMGDLKWITWKEFKAYLRAKEFMEKNNYGEDDFS